MLAYDLNDFRSIMMDSYDQAMKSPDPSTQNGAVLITQDDQLAFGHNNFPLGVDPKYWEGSKDDKYARVCHAEVSALLDAARLGFSTERSILVCGWAACSNCAKYISLAGVKTLVRHPYGDNTTGTHWLDDCMIGDEIMKAAGVEIIEIPPADTWQGTLRRNGELWRP